ncbi:MAG: hypothetical protein GY705_11835 [Bacteroidetes bacterium]|nr:hypothetical protein [Bacteroidota bacterium]
MKFRLSKYITLLSLTFILFSCNGQSNHKKIKEKTLIGKIEKPNGDVHRGFLDKDDNLWFGTTNDGLYKYDGSKFVHFTEQDGISDKKISCIYQANNGDLWFGTTTGIYIFNGTEFKHLQIPKTEISTDWLKNSFPSVNPNEVQSINQDKNGIYWLGTNGAGAYRYDGKTFTNHLAKIGETMPDGLYHNIIQSITRDNNEDLWFASMSHGGVSKFDGKNFVHFGIKDGLSDNMTRTIYTDNGGVIWFGFNGSRESGLTSYNGEFNTYSVNDGLCNPSILSIYEDNNGNLWLGSGRNGLCVFDGKNFVEFESKHGKINSRILFVLGDSENNIWFGNGRNLFWKYDGEKVTDMTRINE